MHKRNKEIAEACKKYAVGGIADDRFKLFLISHIAVASASELFDLALILLSHAEDKKDERKTRV